MSTRLLGAEMGALCQEQVRVLLLDRRNRRRGAARHLPGERLLHRRQAGRGAAARRSWRASPTSSSPTTTRAVTPSPSPQDINVTKELRQAAKLLGLELLDHVVIGANEAVSLKDRGLLD